MAVTAIRFQFRKATQTAPPAPRPPRPTNSPVLGGKQQDKSDPRCFKRVMRKTIIALAMLGAMNANGRAEWTEWRAFLPSMPSGYELERALLHDRETMVNAVAILENLPSDCHIWEAPQPEEIRRFLYAYGYSSDLSFNRNPSLAADIQKQIKKNEKMYIEMPNAERPKYVSLLCDYALRLTRKVRASSPW